MRRSWTTGNQIAGDPILTTASRGRFTATFQGTVGGAVYQYGAFINVMTSAHNLLNDTLSKPAACGVPVFVSVKYQAPRAVSMLGPRGDALRQLPGTDRGGMGRCDQLWVPVGSAIGGTRPQSGVVQSSSPS